MLKDWSLSAQLSLDDNRQLSSLDPAGWLLPCEQRSCELADGLLSRVKLLLMLVTRLLSLHPTAFAKMLQRAGTVVLVGRDLVWLWLTGTLQPAAV